MTANLAKPGVDLGIVISDSEKALAFYCGLLGLEHVGDMPMPIAGGGTMHRVQCGDSLLKLVKLNEDPPADSGGGIPGSQGFRYLTLTVTNIEEIAAACEANEVTVAVPITTVREGVTILMVEDPDGNWVEFVQLG